MKIRFPCGSEFDPLEFLLEKKLSSVQTWVDVLEDKFIAGFPNCPGNKDKKLHEERFLNMPFKHVNAFK